MKKKTVRKKKAVVRKKRGKSPYAQAAEDFDPYDVVTEIQSETVNSGPTLTEEFELGKPGWWSRMWRRVFG